VSWFHAFEYCISNDLFLPSDDQWSYAAGVHEGREYLGRSCDNYSPGFIRAAALLNYGGPVNRYFLCGFRVVAPVPQDSK